MRQLSSRFSSRHHSFADKEAFQGSLSSHAAFKTYWTGCFGFFILPRYIHRKCKKIKMHHKLWTFLFVFLFMLLLVLRQSFFFQPSVVLFWWVCLNLCDISDLYDLKKKSQSNLLSFFYNKILKISQICDFTFLWFFFFFFFYNCTTKVDFYEGYIL